MSLLSVRGLSLSYGPKVLFSGAALAIGDGHRVGLVGANGTGKSTFLRVLVGQTTPDDGVVTLRRDARVGYLPQDLQELPAGDLVDAVMSTVPGREQLDARLSGVGQALEAASDEAEQLSLAATLADLHEAKEHFDERFGRHRAERLLLGLGFSQRDFSRPTHAFSGGWRMRAALAGLLLQDPDLLLLDEPTNHLDLPSLAWFDGFLRRSRRSLVLISHDRAFLDRQVDHIVSLEPEGLRTWRGNFEDYQRQRAEEAERLLAQAEKVATRRAQLQAFVDRFRAKASKAKQAQSKMRQLEKLESVEVHQRRDTVGFHFPPVPPSGREVARFAQVRKAFGDGTVVYDGLDAQVLRGQRIAVVGLNGTGKTTLLRLLAGELLPDAGTVTLGHGVRLGYYAQHHADTLDVRRTILEQLMTVAEGQSPASVRSTLGAFLFSGDDVDKRIGVLSGGERARVALARLLLAPANLLVMDEPTNHLDLDSSEALIEALEGYEGTLVFVSHNRSFLNALATHVWDVRQRTVVPFPGNLDEYLAHLALEAAAREQGESPAQPEASSAPQGEKARRRAEAMARQAKSERTAPLKKELAALEADIARLESLQREREAQLADAAFVADYASARPVMEAHRTDAEALEAAYARWEAVQAALDALD